MGARYDTASLPLRRKSEDLVFDDITLGGTSSGLDNAYSRMVGEFLLNLVLIGL